MAIPFLNNINLDDNQLLNAKLHVTSSAPTAAAGQIYFDSTAGVTSAKYYANATDQWVTLSEYNVLGSTFINLTKTETNSTDAKFTLQASLSASGTPDSTVYLRGDNTWSPISTIPGTYTFDVAADSGTEQSVDSGDTLEIQGTTYISTTVTSAATDPVIEISHDSTSRSDTTSTDSPAFGGTFTAVQSVTTNATGHVTAIDVSTVTLPTPAASDNYQYWTLSDGTNSTNIGSLDTATFQGTTNEVEVAESSGTVTIGLPNNVTIGNNLTVTNTLDMTSGQINNLANGTGSNDAVNLGQVQGLIAGVGLFKGGYNANTGLTTDLGAGNGSLDGASNIALDLGDFFAVTVAGTAFFTETLEPGDMIYANTDIAANSSPSIGDYTVVIQDANVAGEGSTDGTTDKGVAGFNSAHFSVTSNGFVSADIYGGGSTLGIVPSGGSASTFLRGDGTFATPTNTTYTADQGVDLNGTTFRADLISYTAQTVAANTASTTASRTYPIQVNSSDKLVVNVPWTDTTGAVTSVDETTPGTSSGTPIVVNPTTGNVLVQSMAYNGGSNIGHVPSGGSATTFLRGDGTWVTPTDTNTVDDVTASTANDLVGISVSPTTGNVVVGLDIDGLVGADPTSINSSYLTFYDSSTGFNRKSQINKIINAGNAAVTYATTITDTATITHSLDTKDVIIQLYDVTTNETVYADVERASVNTATITFATTPTNSIRVLVQKIG